MAPKKRNSEPIPVYSVVLAKLKGYPDWPGKIVTNEEAPELIKKKSAPKDHSQYLVQFFPAGDFAWIPAKEVKLLSTKAIETFLSGGPKKSKSTDIRKAYEVALDSTEWEANRAASFTAYAEETERYAQLDDQEEEEDELEQETTTASKKRKRADPKEKLVRESAAEKRRKKAKLDDEAAKPDTKSKKRVAATYSDDDAEGSSKKTKTTVPLDMSPGAVQVRDWRHKLQKVFLGKGVKADEMPKCKEYFDAMEDFAITEKWLADSKLGKVLKRITQLADGVIPDEDTYKFRDRAADITNKWTNLLHGDSTPAPATNGAEVVAEAEPVKMDEDASAAAEAVEEAIPAPAEPVVEAPVPEEESAPVAAVEEVAAPEPVVEAPVEVVEEKMEVEVDPVVENGASEATEKVEDAPVEAEAVAPVV